MKLTMLKSSFAACLAISLLIQPALAAGALAAVALAAGEKEPAVADLSWMAGDWKGEKWDGLMQESWSKPSGDAMTCMFSHTKQGKPVFYEFITIEKNENGLAMYLRHFSPKSVAWEDKESALVFSVKIVSSTEVVFERVEGKNQRTKLVYKLEAPDKLTSILEREKDGKTTTEVFNYRRA